MDERELERMARMLGRKRAEMLDLERMARGVAERLRREAKPLHPYRTLLSAPLVLRLAAALVVAGGVLFLTLPRRAAPEAGLIAVPQLYDLSEDQLVEVLDSLALELPVSEHVVVLSDLNELELQELLRVMEG